MVKSKILITNVDTYFTPENVDVDRFNILFKEPLHITDTDSHTKNYNINSLIERTKMLSQGDIVQRKRDKLLKTIKRIQELNLSRGLQNTQNQLKELEADPAAFKEKENAKLLWPKDLPIPTKVMRAERSHHG
jgi:hypothetical protein